MALEKAVADPAIRSNVKVQAFWLFMWLLNNIGITMLNKYAFSKAGFHYPLVTSAFHMICNWLGTAVYFAVSGTERTVVQGQQWFRLFMFSVVFSLNIAVGNYSSMLVSVKFNQVMRSLVPAIVMVLGTQLFNKTFSKARKLAVLPIMSGVALACYGEMAVNVMSFVVTGCCVLLAALKVLLSGEMLTGSMKMPPLHLLSHMAPMAFGQMAICAVLNGEVDDLLDNWKDLKGGYALWVVLLTGVGSFSLNLCSLQANKVTSPLTLSIMANVKQVLLIILDMLTFGTSTTLANITGIVMVVIFSCRYSMLSVQESNRQTKAVEDESSEPILPK